MWVLRWEQDAPAVLPGPGWQPLYSFRQHTELHSHHNPLTTEGGWGVDDRRGGLVRKRLLISFTWRKQFSHAKTPGFSCGFPVWMMINLSVCSILYPSSFLSLQGRGTASRHQGGTRLLSLSAQWLLKCIIINSFSFWFHLLLLFNVCVGNPGIHGKSDLQFRLQVKLRGFVLVLTSNFTQELCSFWVRTVFIPPISALIYISLPCHF